MKPHVVILSAFFTPFRSGAEAMVEEVGARLLPHYRVTVITSRLSFGLKRREDFGGVSVVRVGIGTRFDKWLYPFLAPVAALRAKPDLLHAVLESYAGMALVFCRLLRRTVPTLLTLQSTNTRLLLWIIHRVPHAVTAISATLLKRAKSFERRDVIHIPNGIDAKSIAAATRAVTRNPRRILFVGRLERMKGVDILLHAFSLLDDKSVELHVVGEGSRRSSLIARARALGIAERVRFTGYLPVPAVYGEYAASAVFCGLSRSEALGNVFLEAQAAGCAVVATAVGGIPEIVRDRVTGFLVPPDDPQAAKDAIELLLNEDNLRAGITQAAQMHALKYDWDTITAKYVDVYRRLLPADAS